ncbi:MAG: DUF899 domain-containing protein [Parvibaculum sp.]
MTDNMVVGREAWIVARKALLEEEKALTHAREALAAKRRGLPWVKLEKDYQFEGEKGPVSLAALFGPHRQLVIQHFMFGPDWEEGCPSCSFMADGYSQQLPHLAARDVAMVAVSRAPLTKLLAYRKRLGWLFPWVSSLGSDFNVDFQVSFPKDGNGVEQFYNYEPKIYDSEEMPGISTFYKNDAGEIFHTYSTFNRGLDDFIMAYRFLDIVPRGRDEEGLSDSMDWVKRRDKY